MQRHATLIPLSHEHFAALAVVRHVRTAAAALDTASLVAELLGLNLEAHFRQEEQELVPLLADDLRERLAREHADLRADLAQLAAAPMDQPRLLAAVERLHDHIRWEERTVFMWLQAQVR